MFPLKKLSTNSVIVIHPGTQHSHQVANGLLKAGLLKKFITGIFFSENSRLASFIEALPAFFFSKIKSLVRQRKKAKIPQEKLKNIILPELVFIIASRIRLNQTLLRKVIYWRNRVFAKMALPLVKKTSPSALICFESSALEIFSNCPKNCLKVLDHPSSSLNIGLNLLNEEADLNPEFADSVRIDAPPWYLKQLDLEAKIADLILAGSEYVKNTLVKSGINEEKISVLPYGVDITKFTPDRGKKVRKEREKFTILFVGNISQRKGIKYLLEAFVALEAPDIHLTLIGNITGSQKPLEKYLNCQNIEHLSFLPYHKLPEEYRKADIFVFPALHEGSALVTYEALASGLPVVTTFNSGSIVEDGKNGFIVPIRSIEKLQEKIMFFYQHPQKVVEFGKEARRRAEMFTWKNYYSKLFRELEVSYQNKTRGSKR